MCNDEMFNMISQAITESHNELKQEIREIRTEIIQLTKITNNIDERTAYLREKVQDHDEHIFTLRKALKPVLD